MPVARQLALALGVVEARRRGEEARRGVDGLLGRERARDRHLGAQQHREDTVTNVRAIRKREGKAGMDVTPWRTRNGAVDEALERGACALSRLGVPKSSSTRWNARTIPSMSKATCRGSVDACSSPVSIAICTDLASSRSRSFWRSTTASRIGPVWCWYSRVAASIGQPPGRLARCGQVIQFSNRAGSASGPAAP
jgi:hypothetical protein